MDELNLLIDALESAIDLAIALGKDSTPYQEQLDKILVPLIQNHKKKKQDFISCFFFLSILIIVLLIHLQI